MTISSMVKDKNISEILHFTTSHGCLGTLYTEALQSRLRLQNDHMVKYLFSPNSDLRKDMDYIDYVSLSISHINTQFFNTSSRSWHREDDIFWCIMSFDPVILSHDGVVFATTNNIYTGVVRGEGENGFQRLFSPHIVRWNGNVVARVGGLEERYPTCAQAEALYPSTISTDFLQRIYVSNATEQSEIMGFLNATFHRDVEVVIDPSKFGERR